MIKQCLRLFWIWILSRQKRNNGKLSFEEDTHLNRQKKKIRMKNKEEDEIHTERTHDDNRFTSFFFAFFFLLLHFTSSAVESSDEKIKKKYARMLKEKKKMSMFCFRISHFVHTLFFLSGWAITKWFDYIFFLFLSIAKQINENTTKKL